MKKKKETGEIKSGRRDGKQRMWEEEVGGRLKGGKNKGREAC